MKKTILLFSILLLITSCISELPNEDSSFQRFVQNFKPIELPLDTTLLYRVYNSDVVTARIDTLLVQEFIDKDYKLRINQRVHDGYGYAVRLPREDTLLYEGLIHYISKGYAQFFVLNTYSLNGKLVSSLPISGVRNNHERLTGYISKNRIISTRASILHQPDSGAAEYLYEIDQNGTIMPLDTFFEQ